MDSVRAMLDLESAASEEEVLEALKQLTVKLLKDLCWEKSLKLSGNKAQLIGHLLLDWAHSFADDSDGKHSAMSSGSSAVAGSSGCCEMPSFQQIRAWNKDLLVCAISFQATLRIPRKQQRQTFQQEEHEGLQVPKGI